MKDSLSEFALGVVLIVFSFPVLWFNESRNAKMESLLGRGRSQCRTVSGEKADAENRNWLVHLQGEPMRSAAQVGDPQFDVVFEDNCVRLRSIVEVFQYIQHEKKEEKERLGGGKDTITTYTYSAEWSSAWHDSSGYADQSKRNSKPAGLDPGSHTMECARVDCGGAFALPEGLVVQCSEFISAAPRLGGSVKQRSGGASFHQGGDELFYFRVDGDISRQEARVGDARVRFQYVPDGPVSILALQADRPGQERECFLPYRLISRGWCGMSEDDEKAALRKVGELTGEQLAEQAVVGGGCLWCLCCACNLVNMCFSGVLTQEVYHLFHGSKGSAELFDDISARAQLVVWVLRFVGWVMLFAGLYMLFSPLLTFIKVIPWLGPILSKFGGALIWVMCLVVTLAVASVVVCLAYLVYHPLLALLYSAVAGACIAIPIAIAHAMH